MGLSRPNISMSIDVFAWNGVSDFQFGQSLVSGALEIGNNEWTAYEQRHRHVQCKIRRGEKYFCNSQREASAWRASVFI